MKVEKTSWRARVAALPIVKSLPELDSALEGSGVAVLAAPPGSGKTTVVPLHMAAAAYLRGERIIMLEPRRLAARAAARRMAWILGEEVGETVGYRMRNDTRVGPRTVVEVVTEGVLTRLIRSDPLLSYYGAVVFDEFHERNLHGDVGLTLALRAREVRRSLRLLVMSATLDTAAVSTFLGGAPVVSGGGELYPVEIRYNPPRADQGMEGGVVSAIRRALRESDGSVLAFLPGVGEIGRVAGEVRSLEEARGVRIHTLHSGTAVGEQDEAIRTAPPGVRKVVIATSIAESSLTIDGISAVVDSGYSRVPRYQPSSGLTRLDTVRVSRASADQRAGRAGRTSNGICYRVWDAHEEQMLPSAHAPEILEADLAPLLLDLAAMGVSDPSELRWMDPPPPPAVKAARDLLFELGALDEKGELTPHGKEMTRLSLHPRLAHMAIMARPINLVPLACDLAAVLEERDFLKVERVGEDVDIRTRVHLLNVYRRRVRSGKAVPTNAEPAILARALREADRLRKELRADDSFADERASGLLLAFAYPERIAMRRDAGNNRYLLRNGAGIALPLSQALSVAPMIVAADVDGRKPESRVWMAAPVDSEDVLTHFQGSVTTVEGDEWDSESESVRWVRREQLGAIVLRRDLSAPRNRETARSILLDQLRREGVGQLPWTDGAKSLRDRVMFLRHHDASWPDMSDAALLKTLDIWLAPVLNDITSMKGLRKLDLRAALLRLVPPQRVKELDALAPVHITSQRGTRMVVDYADPASPAVSVRLQELFGQKDTPRVLGNKVPVTLHILSPARRPVQVTRDLAGFWKGSYQEVRKAMRSRYPKHDWPEKGG